VRYLLRRVDAHLRVGTPPDYEQLTIEHLAPQSPSSKGVSPGSVGMLGNLLLVTESQNGKLGNKVFAEKMKILKASDVPLDDPLRKAKRWDDAAIEARTKSLATLCYEKIFRV